jgi:dTDP-4-dehydrorhamnose 3,5-epimerase
VHEATEPALLTVPYQEDARGAFAKPFFGQREIGAAFVTREIFWTTSSAGTIRGLHFQTPPVAGSKLVWVSRGSVVDVVVDLRPHSGFGAVVHFDLTSDRGLAVWVPVGFAHGFQALEDGTIVNYAVDAPYAPANDTGVLWSSIDFDWPLPAGPVSARDQSFVALHEFASPFEVAR